MGTCKGDSGGPAITRRFYDGSFHYTVLGVVSGNPRPLNCGLLPDFYTYVGNEKVSENSSSNLQLPVATYLSPFCLYTYRKDKVSSLFLDSHMAESTTGFTKHKKNHKINNKKDHKENNNKTYY